MKKELLKINLLMTFFTVLANVGIFFGVSVNSIDYSILNFYIAICIQFSYFYLIFTDLKRNFQYFSREALNTNYALYIIFFLVFLFLTAIGCYTGLFLINKEVLNITTLFMLFVKILSVIFPSIVSLFIIYFLSPAFIIPKLKIKYQKYYKIIHLLFFAIFVSICLFQFFNAIKRTNTLETNKYDCSKQTIRFSTDLLHFHKEIDFKEKEKMSNETIEIPFYYTTNPVIVKSYDEAESFCKSINARVSSHLEVFHVLFGKFNILGDNYYWISKDSNLVLHFKNMSYTIEKLPKDVTPLLFCTAKADNNYKKEDKKYFYKFDKIEKKGKRIVIQKETLDNKKITAPIKQTENKKQKIYNNEKKHVNFSVKEVTPDYMQNLIHKGYIYDTSAKIRKEYEASEYKLNTLVINDKKNIRLCYYPFTDYGTMSIDKERQVWEQSFCSPAFTLLNQSPDNVYKVYKDIYCTNQGGRLPNLPELAAILKIKGNNEHNIKFWTNNKLYDYTSGTYSSVAAYYKDSRFIFLEEITSNVPAYAYCIKEINPPSRIIANYKSKFKGYNGNSYAKKICPDCYYYEVPDVIAGQ